MELHLPDPLTSLPDYKHKSDSDEFLANSSDPPLFSSDPPIFSTSMEDYQQPKLKRQRKGPWFEMEEEPMELRRRKQRKHPALRRATRQRHLRKIDSGVYMGSDETIASESSRLTLSFHTTTNRAPKDEGWDSEGDNDDDEEMERDVNEKREHLVAPEEYSEEQLFEKAIQTTDDPGDFEGPVFPYWDNQPTQLAQFHRNQKLAYEKVLECVDDGSQSLDLSHFNLEKLRTPTLQPLRYHVKQPMQLSQSETTSVSSVSPQYEPLSPSLALHLSNASLTAFPPGLHLLTNLTFLSLFNNHLTSLPSSISQLTNLHTLNVASNQLNYLPYSLLHLILSGHLQTLICHPNPFLNPILPNSTASLDWLETQQFRGPSRRDAHRISTTIAYLDIDGRPLSSSPPPPSQTPSYTPPPKPPLTSSVPTLHNPPPSLLELSLRTLLPAPELSRLPFHLPASESPHLNSLLKHTFHLRESGGQPCTICGNEFVVARTEWVQWHNLLGRLGVPLLRRGCGWGCVGDMEGREGVFWGSGWSVPDMGDGKQSVVGPEPY